MKKEILLVLTISLILSFTLNFSLANSVCGRVNDYRNFSAVGLNVQVVSAKNISSVTNCLITSVDNRFCCFLNDTTWAAGINVTAEVFDSQTGYVSNKVSNITTADDPSAYFPDMNLTEAIKVVNSSDTLLVNQSVANLTLQLADGYTNLNYTIYSDNIANQTSVCTDCSSVNLSIPLSKGKNRVVLTSYGNHIIEKELTFYNLNYLKITRNISCDKYCTSNLWVPSNYNVTMTVTINSSHSIDIDSNELYPVQYTLLSEDSTPYSSSHNLISWHINSSFAQKSYLVKTPNVILPRRYAFEEKIGEYSKLDSILIHQNFLSLYIPVNLVIPDWTPTKYFKITPSTPLIIKNPSSQLAILAIFSKENTSAFYRINQNVIDSHKTNYTILTNLPNSEVFVRLESDLDSNITLFAPDAVSLNVKTDGDKKIYEGYINSKEFQVQE